VRLPVASAYMLGKSALIRIPKWSWIKAWGVKAAHRRGIKSAIIALARRMAVVLHRMWVDGTDFQWTKEGAVAA